MKYRLLTGFTVLLICGFGIFGRIKLATYTNITSDPSFVNEFSYEEPDDNIIYPVSGDSTYVPYKAVSGNEFFAVDSEGLEAFRELKEFLLQMYQ